MSAIISTLHLLISALRLECSECMRYVGAVEAREYICLIDGELGADSLEFSASVSTYVLYNFQSLITTHTHIYILKKTSQFNLVLFLFPSILSLRFPICLSVAGLPPRGT